MVTHADSPPISKRADGKRWKTLGDEDSPLQKKYSEGVKQTAEQIALSQLSNSQQLLKSVMLPELASTR